ncbi:flagellar biosynthesis protein FlhF [Dokdonella sp. MW10]|uniref:flagellar biosynthesis protein FlhF n=1 Tax=Dokdonella sp. MW10 TaxID=2992926 RepID=UPI003F81086E
MKIKRYVAADMRQAMQMVRDDQGPDAVILSSRRVDGMNEIVAAIDYDEALVREAVGQMRAGAVAELPSTPVQAAAPAPAKVVRRQVPTQQHAQAPQKAPSTLAPSPASLRASPDEAARLLMQSTLPRKATAPNRASFDVPATPAFESPATQVAPVAAAPQRPAPVTPPVEAVAPAPVTAPAPAPVVVATTPAAPIPAVAPATPVNPANDPAYQRMQRELSQLRQLLEAQLSSLAWNDMDRRQPLRTQVLRDMTRLGIEPDVAIDIVEDLPADMTPDQSRYLPLGLLSRRLTIGGKDFADQGGAIALVGPTGSGKTTTIAKLAARHAEKYGRDQVALICTDDYRIGAQDQLLQYGRLLGVQAYTARNGAELSKLLVHLADRRLVLIDTPGMNHRDERLVSVLDTLRANVTRVRSLLVLAANTQAAALEESLRTYSDLDPSGCVLTKLDETPTLGPAVSILIRHALALHYTTDGQRVPQDIAVADARRVVCRIANPTVAAVADELAMADRFSRGNVAFA